MNFLNLLRRVWNWIQDKIIRPILSFAKHIVSWFKNPKRLENLRKDSDLIAVSIKDNLQNGNYNTVNCLFDKSSNEIVDMTSTSVQGIESEKLADDTENAFGNKPMVILQ